MSSEITKTSDYWMPAFAGMANLDGRDKPGHDETFGGMKGST